MDDELSRIVAETRAFDSVTGAEITDDKSMIEAVLAGHDIINKYRNREVIAKASDLKRWMNL